MSDHAGMQILLVDDDTRVLELLRDALEIHGYDCVLAHDGQTALNLASNESYDLVVLDVKMPGISGIEALRVLKERDPLQPVIMVTAVADIPTAIKAMQLNALDYLTKPFSVKDLLTAVDRAIEKGAIARGEHST
jgi:DNA-binding NtrC family response regulator